MAKTAGQRLIILSSAIKDWTDVPRPTGSLVETSSSAFPSGHTAYAITYVTIAVTLERVRDIVVRATLVVIAIALAAAVGLSRVYLRAHYLSDVIGGAALTATITATFAALALLLLHIRKLRAADDIDVPASEVLRLRRDRGRKIRNLCLVGHVDIQCTPTETLPRPRVDVIYPRTQGGSSDPAGATCLDA